MIVHKMYEKLSKIVKYSKTFTSPILIFNVSRTIYTKLTVTILQVIIKI